MKGYRLSSFLIRATVFLFSPFAVNAQIPNTGPIVHLTGTRTPKGNLRITVEPGVFVTHAMRILSEPSGTLLLTVVDQPFAKTGAGAAWLQNKRKGTGALVLTDLPQGQAAIEIPPPPSTDNVLSVWVNGTWPGVGDEERLVSEAKVTLTAFDFTTKLSSNASGAAFMEHCCSGVNCGMQCVECSGPKFTCCLSYDPGCCSIDCGWVNCPC